MDRPATGAVTSWDDNGLDSFVPGDTMMVQAVDLVTD